MYLVWYWEVDSVLALRLDDDVRVLRARCSAAADDDDSRPHRVALSSLGAEVVRLDRHHLTMRVIRIMGTIVTSSSKSDTRRLPAHP